MEDVCTKFSTKLDILKVEVSKSVKKGRLLPSENRSYNALPTPTGGRFEKKRPNYCLIVSGHTVLSHLKFKEQQHCSHYNNQ